MAAAAAAGTAAAAAAAGAAAAFAAASPVPPATGAACAVSSAAGGTAAVPTLPPWPAFPKSTAGGRGDGGGDGCHRVASGVSADANVGGSDHDCVSVGIANTSGAAASPPAAASGVRLAEGEGGVGGIPPLPVSPQSRPRVQSPQPPTPRVAGRFQQGGGSDGGGGGGGGNGGGSGGGGGLGHGNPGKWTSDLWHFSKEGNAAQAEAELRRRLPETPPRLKRLVYNTAIKAAGNGRDSSRAWRLFEEMLHNAVEPSVRTFGKLFHAGARANDTALMARALKTEREMGLKVDATKYNMMLSFLGRDGDLGAAEHWLKRFREAGLVPTEHTYSAMVTSAAMAGDLRTMESYLRQAIDAGVPLLTGLCSAVVDAYLKGGQPEAARMWFEWSVEAGSSETAATGGRQRRRPRGGASASANGQQRGAPPSTGRAPRPTSPRVWRGRSG